MDSLCPQYKVSPRLLSRSFYLCSREPRVSAVYSGPALCCTERLTMRRWSGIA